MTRYALTDQDYQDEIPAGRLVEIVSEEKDEEGIETWTVCDQAGTLAVVPAGSLVEITRPNSKRVGTDTAKLDPKPTIVDRRFVRGLNFIADRHIADRHPTSLLGTWEHLVQTGTTAKRWLIVRVILITGLRTAAHDYWINTSGQVFRGEQDPTDLHRSTRTDEVVYDGGER